MHKTIQQLTNELTGRRKLKEKANHAITVWYKSCEIESTFYSKRGARFNRGIKIN